MEQEQKPTDRSGRRATYWATVLTITIVLAVPAYLEWVRVSQTQARLADSRARERNVLKEHEKWKALTQQQDDREKRVSQLKRDVAAALKSFSRDELHDALKRAIVTARPDKAIVLETSRILWGMRSWVWVPEEGHELYVRLTTTGQLPEDAVDGPLEDQRLQIPMNPAKVHVAQFSIEERYQSKDCVLRLQVDDEMILEKTLLLNPSGSTSRGGSNDGILIQPRVLSSNWIWRQDPLELLQHGVWFSVDRQKFTLRPYDNEDKRTVQISLSMGIANREKPLYAARFSKAALKKHGIEFTEVTDPTSHYHNLLQLTPPPAPPLEAPWEADRTSPKATPDTEPPTN